MQRFFILLYFETITLRLRSTEKTPIFLYFARLKIPETIVKEFLLLFVGSTLNIKWSLESEDFPQKKFVRKKKN
jgi:hypothetical protein